MVSGVTEGRMERSVERGEGEGGLTRWDANPRREPSGCVPILCLFVVV